MKGIGYFIREILRIILFLSIIAFYLTTKIGLVIGLVHLFLVFRYPQKYGMSRILVAIIERQKSS